MFGDTVTVTYSGESVILKKINQDGYSSEYLSRSATNELRMKIRHSKESLKPGQSSPIERHNVLLSNTVFSTDPMAASTYADVSFTIRCAPGESATYAGLVVPAFIGWMGTSTALTAKVSDLTNWVS